MIEAILQELLAKFQTAHFTKCFKQWGSCWATCIKSQGDCFEGGSMDWKMSIVVCSCWEVTQGATWSHYIHLCTVFAAIYWLHMSCIYSWKGTSLPQSSVCNLKYVSAKNLVICISSLFKQTCYHFCCKNHVQNECLHISYVCNERHLEGQGWAARHSHTNWVKQTEN